jgi:aminoglycoside phosphotransferase (APT) family kinase protein
VSDWAEAEWERLTPYVEISDAELGEILAPHGAAPPAAVLGGGTTNTNYRVEDLVVRIYERDGGAAERERRLLELVADAVPTPKLLGNGETRAGTPYGVFEFIEGVHPYEVLDERNATKIGRSLGAGLRALEVVELPAAPDALGLFAPDLSFELTFESVAESFVGLIESSLNEGRSGKRLGAELCGELAAQLDQAAQRLEAVEDWRGLVHSDYKFSNLLLAPGGVQLAAVLDWEFTCAFSPLLDVAIMMRHRDDFPAGFEEGFEEGHGALPDDWRELSRIIDLMNLVGFLNAPGERPKLYGHVTRRVASTIELIRRRGT